MQKKWKCVCGFIHDGAEPPRECPKCGAPAEKFTALAEEAAQLIERSRHTNALLCRLVSLGREMEQLCKDGISDNLDPNCVGVFKKTLDHSYEIMKLSMTELQGHVAKGTWG